jgi:hypothetical protein
LGVLLLGTVYSLSSPVFAACDVQGSYTAFECSIEGVNIELTGPSATVTINDHTLDPTTSGFVRILADDSALNPTALTVNVTGTTTIRSPDYDGIDVRTVRGPITVNIGDDTLVDAAQTGVFVESYDPDVVGSYDSGSIVINNRGRIQVGPDGGVMGSNGIVGRTNGGGVQINNYGTVTTSRTVYDSWDTYGILADGGGSSITPVEVGIYNDGTVSSLNDALRVNSYNGLGKVVNDVNGVLTSSGRRGVVVWSAIADAELENYGSITALDGTGINVWGATGARVINDGVINAYNNASTTGGPSTFVGAHIWAQTSGDATLDNGATGRIDAHDGFGVWMQSANGDVVIDNAGVIKGQYNAVMVTGDNVASLTGEPLTVYQGAQGGAITLDNSGLLTAYGLAEDGIPGRGLVTLAGDGLSAVTLNNKAGGLIGAGIELGSGFDTGLLDGSATELSELSPALGNLAIAVGADASGDGINITNDGTILGRIALGSANALFGTGPIIGDTGFVDNRGVWVTSGESMTGLVANSGITWVVGSGSLLGSFNNDGGTLVLAATGDAAASFSIANDFTGGDIAFDVGTGSQFGSGVLLDIGGDAYGTSTLSLADMSGWDWLANGGTRDVIAVGGQSTLGADSFVLGTPYRGLVAYELDYTASSDEIWTLQASFNDQSTDEIADIAGTTAATLTDVTSGAIDRAAQLRKLFQENEDVQPMGYAASPASPVDEAFAALTPDGAPALRFWSEGQASLGVTDIYSGQKAGLHFGADVSAQAGDSWFAGGVFGALSGKGLDFDSGNTADISAGAIGVYGTVETASGFYVAGTYALESATADIAIFGEAATFGALLHGGELDAGYRTAIGEFEVEPSLGLRFGRVSYDDFDMSGTTVSTADTDTLAAEARLQVSRSLVSDGLTVTPFAIVALGNAISTGGDLTVDNIGLVDALEGDGLYGKLSAGVEVGSADGRLQGFARAESTLSEDALWGAVKVGGSVGF